MCPFAQIYFVNPRSEIEKALESLKEQLNEDLIISMLKI